MGAGINIKQIKAVNLMHADIPMVCVLLILFYRLVFFTAEIILSPVNLIILPTWKYL